QNATLDKQASSAILKGLNETVGDILKAAEKRVAAAMGCNFTRGICSVFIDKARKVINPRSRGRMLPPMCQACLLCDHGSPRYGTTPL
ncbi:hypothetical protein PMAYCL1PPCAC_25887, partial [Pristionchus mayeri]